jgi:lysophospholipase L1-like esterase
MDKTRRGLLGGALTAGAGLGLAGTALGQDLSAVRPPELGATPTQPQVPLSSDTTSSAAALRTPVAPPPAPPKPRPAPDWANLSRYRSANEAAKTWAATERRAVFMGDSITAHWFELVPEFFTANGFVGRGISGQTTAQMVVRFYAEVIDLKPKVVHILAGTNDVAENLDPYDFAQTTRNLMAMTDMAAANHIRVVMGSVPPATSFSWRPDRGNQAETIRTLNAWIEAYCRAKGYTYADYWPGLALPDGGLKAEFGNDSVHPNAAGYAVMARVAIAAVAKAAKRA